MLRKAFIKIKYSWLEEWHQSDAKQLMRSELSPKKYFSQKIIPLFKSWEDTPSIGTRNFEFEYVTPLPETDTMDVLGLIVETRRHPRLIDAIVNVRKTTNVPILVVCADKNLNMLQQSALKDEIGQSIFIVKIIDDLLSSKDYNAMFMSLSFWNMQPRATKVLVFQTDGYINPSSKYSLKDFLHFDYIGAHFHCRFRNNGLIIDGGVGGVSIRDQVLSMNAIEQFASLGWVGGEDDFFGFGIEALGGKVGRKKFCNRFCQQYHFVGDSFAIHQPAQMKPNDRAKLLQLYPDVKDIIGLKG